MTVRLRHRSGHPLLLPADFLAAWVVATCSGTATWKETGDRQSRWQRHSLSRVLDTPRAQHAEEDLLTNAVGIASGGLMRREARMSFEASQPYPVLPRGLDPCGAKRPCRGFAGCIGGPEKLGQGIATIKSLRATGNRDPVQIFHVDRELQSDAVQALEMCWVHDGIFESIEDMLAPVCLCWSLHSSMSWL